MELFGRDTPSLEDYLEAIYELSKQHGNVRMSFVAEKLHVTKASVSRALASLKSRGYIEQERYGTLLLTEIGTERASEIFHRHCLFRKLLTDVFGVPMDIAEADACRMEHVVSPQTIEAVERFLDAR